ncbi:hypothetical protein BRADI_4g09291v3 [Brachypodium distachyon]|uniref:Uncharacterized protein n=1 Tax=Brachypodium distachyon TaxID=15368 RepID=A0A0Q3EL55_BRADI|nr:hypothetical protein BRADI_4g09291v3 [Brachypodium distachyon]
MMHRRRHRPAPHTILLHRYLLESKHRVSDQPTNQRARNQKKVGNGDGAGCIRVLHRRHAQAGGGGRGGYAARRRRRYRQYGRQARGPQELPRRRRPEEHHRPERQGVGAELKRAMYDATDILDDCQLKAMDRQGVSSSSSCMACWNPLLFCLRNPLHARDIGIRIKELNQKLDAIKERSAAFGFINLGSYEDRRSKVQPSRLSASRETSGELDRSGVVGEKIEKEGYNNQKKSHLARPGNGGKSAPKPTHTVKY